MKFWGLCCGFLALVIFILPAVTAQQEEKKVEEKTEEKKGEETTPKKVEKKKEEKLAHGQVISYCKMTKVDTANGLVVTIDVQYADPQKVANVENWRVQQEIQIASMAVNNANDAQNKLRRVAQFQAEYSHKMATEIYSTKGVEVKAAEGMKVRLHNPPFQYDDQGKPKRWTEKEKAKLKAGSTLPGYPGDVENLRAGQIVEVWLAKQAPQIATKGANTKKKKGPPPVEVPMSDVRPEAVLILIQQDPALFNQ